MLGQEARSKSTRPEASRSQRERTIQTYSGLPRGVPPPWVQIFWASLISGGGTDGVESHKRGLQMQSSPVKGGTDGI